MEEIRPQNHRRCARCGQTFDESFFRRNAGSNCSPQRARRYVCRGCEQTRRDEIKGRNRPRSKAHGAIRTHADKYIRLGLVQTKAEFCERFGWDVAQMEHDIEHAAGNGCPYCRKQFSSMAHGLADVTVDIVDPQALPYYRTNARWVCSTCNKAKHDTPPEEWARTLENWAKWERAQGADSVPDHPNGTISMF